MLTTDDIAVLRASEKFRAWTRHKSLAPYTGERSSFTVERHYTPDELAEAWGVSTETIRSIFRDEPGVLKIGDTGSRHKRGYITLRIPESVVERVHNRLSA